MREVVGLSCMLVLLRGSVTKYLTDALNEHLCPIRRHKRLKYMQAPRSSSQRIRRSKPWCHMHELERPSRQSRQ